MKSKKRRIPSALVEQISRLEQEIQSRGIKIRYERLEAGGLKLKSGLCKVRGQVYLFIDKRKSPQERKEILLDYANRDIVFGDIPEHEGPAETVGTQKGEPVPSEFRTADHEA